MRSSRFRYLAASIAVLAAVLPAAARDHRARIRGVVLDPAFAGVPDAAVRATREETGDTRQVRTDARGRFTVPELPPGPYRVVVEHPGYGRFIARAELAMNQEFRLEVTLQPGPAVQAIDVTSPFIPVDRESPALHTFVDARQLAALPLDGRNFLELASLAPGVVPDPAGATLTGGDAALTINGGREDFNGFLIDGVYNVDAALNSPAVRPPLAAIREFQTFTSSYDASFGRNAAGQISVITRSGGSQLAGSAYGFFRGHALAGRNYFAPADGPAPEYSRHQFGGAIGGPVRREGTFFFVDYERAHLREGVTRVTTVPTAAERTGDFSQSPAGAPVNPQTGQPFAGGVIPLPVQSSAGRGLAALYPLPNRSTPEANYVSSPARREDSDQFDARVDHSLHGGATLMMRYSIGDRRRFEPFAGAAMVPGFGADLPRRAQNFSASFTHAPRRSLVNDLRFGYNRVSRRAAAENGGSGNSTIGLPPFSAGAGLSLITIAGFSPLGVDGARARSSTSEDFRLSDTATWTRGRHIVRTGGDWYAIREVAYRDVLSRGFLTFLGEGEPGNSLGNVLLGLPTLTGGARLDNPQRLRASSWSAFAQDDWRALASFTISAGLRYDFMAPPVDPGNRAAVYDPSARAIVQAGATGVPRGGSAPDRNNLAPRAGFAWTLDAEQHNVLRGGYGIYYNQGALATSEALFFNPPYFDLRVFAPAERPLTLIDPFPASSPSVLPPPATAYQRDLATSWMEHWNVNIQHEIGQTRSLEIAYAGSRGHDLLAARDVNQAQPAGGLSSVRPDPAFADIALIESRASSRYNALQVRYQERPAHGMSLLMSYTLGKSTDDASGLFGGAGDQRYPPDSLNPGADRSRSDFDVRHRFALGVLRQLPIGTGQAVLGNRGWLSAALANMEIAGVVAIQTGRPFTAWLGPDVSRRSAPGFGDGARPNVSGDTAVKTASADQWFNTAAFSRPPAGTQGNSGRNTLEGPGYQNVNLAIVKRMPFGQQGTLELRAEVFNLLDRVNYDRPDAILGSPSFGRILSAGSPRRVQLGLQAQF